jgi:hypothetical protein
MRPSPVASIRGVALLLAGCAIAGTRPVPAEVPPLPPPAPAEGAHGPGGLGDYRFGMTRDEVKAVTSCQPVQGFLSNPDFECPNFQLDGTTRNLSFHFDDAGRLVVLQVWYAEHEELAAAVQAFLDVHDHFRRHFGTTLPPDAARLATHMLSALPPLPDRIVVRPQGHVPDDAVVWAEVTRLAGYGFYVMLYYGYPPAAPKALRAGP